MRKHLKRLAAPRSMSLERKVAKWTMKPSPGPHPADKSVPLGIVVRDYLSLCDTRSEAKKIIGSGKILVDGVARKDIKFPCGLMDVISIPELKKDFRVLFDQRGKITLVPISKKEQSWKLCRIENKTILRGRKTQLNLHDGRNLIVDKDSYKTGDVLKISFSDKKLLGVYPFDKGTIALIVGGAHTGQVATIDEIAVTRSSKPNIVSLKSKNVQFSTIDDYVFPIGKDSPAITLPEVKMK
ncbi:MAG TPA: 30S ribosomal protein S4e [Thermoplasmatales archaeon]|nr:30S ribosomal protein S4e [Thermoplasmatales archaeon]